MSKYTAEQVPHMLRKAAKDAVNPQYRRKFNEAADIIDALLRERESAKASVTDEMVEAAMYACGGDKGAYWAPETYEDWRAALEAVAPMLVPKQNSPSDDFIQNVPDKCDRIIWRKKYYSLPMLASARVPERTSDMTKFVDGLGWVVRLSDVPEYTKRLIEQTRDLLAAAPKTVLTESMDAQRYRLIRSGKSGIPLPLGSEALDVYLDLKLKVAPKPKTEE